MRRSIGVVNQIPFLYKGTIRDNLDPYTDRNDEDIYELLKELEIFDTINELPKKLNTSISRVESTFSLG